MALSLYSFLYSCSSFKYSLIHCMECSHISGAEFYIMVYGINDTSDVADGHS